MPADGAISETDSVQLCFLGVFADLDRNLEIPIL